MKLYVARDQNGKLYMYFGKPVKEKKRGCWFDYNSEAEEVPLEDTEELSQVKWEDEEPVEVELKIK